jgi:hypothetical protein
VNYELDRMRKNSVTYIAVSFSPFHLDLVTDIPTFKFKNYFLWMINAETSHGSRAV